MISFHLSAAPIISQLRMSQAKNPVPESVTNHSRKFSVKCLSENISPLFYWPFLKFALPPLLKPTGNFRSLYIILYKAGTTHPGIVSGMDAKKRSRRMSAEMIPFKPLQKMRERILLYKSDSNSLYFEALLYGGEFLTKLVLGFLVAGINDDKERSRYRFEHELVRADGLGFWADMMQKLFSGPAFVSLDAAAKKQVKELTERVRAPDWRYLACEKLRRVLSVLLIDETPLPAKVSLQQWFVDFTRLRNKTRGHGAPRLEQIDLTCEQLGESVNLVFNQLSLLRVSCAYIRRNLSGKYRVSMLGGYSSPFDRLRKEMEFQYKDGVYVCFDTLHRCSLFKSDSDVSDFFVPNGGFSNKTYELMSPITGSMIKVPADEYMRPIEMLPKSVTDGGGQLDVLGDTFSNLPDSQKDYVERTGLELILKNELLLKDRHPIVTLDGRGGIGKTSTALHVVSEIAKSENCPYETIFWFSARDVDLMPEGAKEVRPAGITIKDFAERFIRLISPLTAESDVELSAVERLAKAFNTTEGGATLFIFDNFETVVSPVELYKWIDTFIRTPNKVLITTRIRGKFKADYPIHVNGMTEQESISLITQTAKRLSIDRQLTQSFIDKLVEESAGHPYVLKIMLGEIARNPSRRSVERVIADRDDVLDALFERTYEMLSPAAQRVFLVLSGWRSLVSELSVEAVLIRSAEELMDVQRAIDELVDFSFVERLDSSTGEVFLAVPLAAQVFGRKKQEFSPFRGKIYDEIALLRNFGVAQRRDISTPLDQRLRLLFANIAGCISRKEKVLDDFRPIIEYVARKLPQAWLYLADLCKNDDNNIELYLRHYVEGIGKDDVDAWWRLVGLYSRRGSVLDELNALTHVARVKKVGIADVCEAVQRAHYLIATHKDIIERVDKRQLLSELATAMSCRVDECAASDLSRLGWLYMNLNDVAQARKMVTIGLSKDPDNYHCLHLYEKIAKRG